MKSYQWKAYLTLALILISIFYLVPTFAKLTKVELPEFWKKHLFSETINLGLDLQGGMHLVLRVETEKAVTAKLDGLASRLQEDMEERGLRFTRVKSLSTGVIQVELVGDSEKDRLEEILSGDAIYSSLKTVNDYIQDRFVVYEMGLTEREIKDTKENAVLQSLETIRNRIDQYGVAEPAIHRQGQDRIMVQLPGIKDPARVKNLMGRTARLEFKLVDNIHNVAEAESGIIPDGLELMERKEVDRETGRTIVKDKLLIEKRILMTGEAISDARVSIDSSDFAQRPYVSLTLNGTGAKVFERITGANVGRRLAIVLDDNVYSAPVINEKIAGGRASIEGRFDMAEARDLASRPSRFSRMRRSAQTVKPSLSQKSSMVALVTRLPVQL